MDHLLTNETHEIFIQNFPNKTYMQEKKIIVFPKWYLTGHM